MQNFYPGFPKITTLTKLDLTNGGEFEFSKIPITQKEAADLSANALKQVIPDTPFRLEEIVLKRYSISMFWYYRISYQTFGGEVQGTKIPIQFFVTMDGSVLPQTTKQ